MRKLMIALAIIAVFVVAIAIKHNNTSDMNYQGDIMLTVGNKLYSAQLSKPGKKLITELQGAEQVELVDYNRSTGASLLRTAHKDEEGLSTYSSKGLKKIYSVSYEKNRYDAAFPFIWKASFGKNEDEVFVIVITDKKRATGSLWGSVVKLDLVTGKRHELAQLPFYNGDIRYIKERNSLLLNIDKTKRQGQHDISTAHSISFYDLGNGKMKELAIDGFSPIWREDTGGFLFFKLKPSSGIYEYDMQNNGEMKKAVYEWNASFSLSQDGKYLLAAVNQDGPKGLIQCIDLIDLSNGKANKINWRKHFNLSPNEFPISIMLVD